MSMEQLEALMDPSNFIGCAKEQTEEYLKNVIRPVLEENKDLIGLEAEINV